MHVIALGLPLVFDVLEYFAAKLAHRQILGQRSSDPPLFGSKVSADQGKPVSIENIPNGSYPITINQRAIVITGLK